MQDKRSRRSRRWTLGAILTVAALLPRRAAVAQEMPGMMGPPQMIVLNMQFYGKGANSPEPGDSTEAIIATGILRGELRRYGQFRVVDSGLTAEAVAKAEATGVPCHTIECARQVAHELGARWVVTSKVSKTSNLIWYMFGWLVDVESGQLLTYQELELKGVSTDIVPLGAHSLSRRLAKAVGAEPLSPDSAGGTPRPGKIDVARLKAMIQETPAEQKPGLAGLDLSALDLQGIDFRHANLAGANLFSSDLTGANLSQTDLTGANLDGTTLRRADLRQARMSHASLFATIVEEADLSGADLSYTRIIGYLKRARLTGAVLKGANIGADPGNQSMGVMRAAFVGADLSNTDLSGANLFKVDFSFANLTGANLQGADLRNGELVQTDFSNADLTEAKLGQANISGAIFKGTRGLQRAHGLNETINRDKAIFDEHME